MGTHRSRARCVERIERLAGSRVDQDQLWHDAIDELRRAVAVDRWCALALDPDSLTGYQGVGEYPPDHQAEVPKLVALDAGFADVNTVREMMRDGLRAATLSAATGGDPARSLRWREIYGPSGIGDELRALAIDARGCWGGLWLFNARGDAAYGEDDLALLRAASTLLAGALRKAAVRTTGRPRAEALPAGVLLLTEDLRLCGRTTEVSAWFELLTGGDAVPVPVWGAVGRLLAIERGEDPTNRPRVRVRATDGTYALIEASRLDGQPGIAVTIRQAGGTEVLDLLTRAHGLSVRERELTTLVVSGLDTRDVAERMSISPYTVKDHLKSVFAKTGVRSRRELVSGLFHHAA